MLSLGLDPDLYSIWKGSKNWEGKEIHLFTLWYMVTLFIWIPYWAWKKPSAFKLILTHLWATPCPSLQNWNETFLGLACALVQSSRFKKRNYTQTHAVWATMPSTVALGSNLLAVDSDDVRTKRARDNLIFNSQSPPLRKTSYA